MPGFIGSVLDCLKDFSNFTTKETIPFTALIVALICKSFKYSSLNPPLKAFIKKYQSLRVILRILLSRTDVIIVFVFKLGGHVQVTYGL